MRSSLTVTALLLALYRHFIQLYLSLGLRACGARCKDDQCLRRSFYCVWLRCGKGEGKKNLNVNKLCSTAQEKNFQVHCELNFAFPSTPCISKPQSFHWLPSWTKDYPPSREQNFAHLRRTPNPGKSSKFPNPFCRAKIAAPSVDQIFSRVYITHFPQAKVDPGDQRLCHNLVLIFCNSVPQTPKSELTFFLKIFQDGDWKGAAGTNIATRTYFQVMISVD